MDQIITFLTRRNIIALLILAVLAVGLVVGVRLVQQQTQLKSKAATTPVCSGSGDSRYCMWFQDAAGGNPTASRDVEVRVVGGQDDQSPQLTGTFSIGSATSFGPGDNCWPGQGIKNCWVFTILGSEYTGGSISESFSSELAQNRVNATFTPPAPSEPPTVTVNVSGKVSNSVDTSQGVEGATVALFTSDGRVTSDGPTRVTPSNGNYSMSATGPIVSYAVRVSNVPAGFDSNSSRTTDGNRSYENQPAAGGCKNNCHFTLAPLAVGAEAATCGPVKTNNQDIRSQTLSPRKTYPVSITMNNPSSVGGADTKEWTRNYSLRWIGTDAHKNDLGLTVTRLDLGTIVESGASHTFPNVNITPAQAGTYVFNWSMFNDSNQKFGGACEIPIVVADVGGPGPSPSPSPGTFDFELDNIDNIEITQGSSGTRQVKVTADESNPRSINIDLSVSDFPSGVDGKFSSESCNSLRAGRTCTRTLTIEADSRASIVTRRNITVTATSDAQSGRVVREERFNLTVSEAVTPFDFTLSTPSDITLTQGQADSGRNITVIKTAGDAEEVTLSISGDTGGAIANFRTSPSCIPDSECQRNLAFNTSQATPSEYFVEIQGRATSGRTKVSNPFRLTINPSVVPSPSPTIPPSPPPPPPPAVKTECFFMDDQPITATSCSDEGAQAYITHPMVIPLTLTTAGRQTVFVRFISTDGQIRSFQRVINFAPDPRLTEISCSHSLSGAGSVVNITGTALGPRGKVKLAGDDATIITWNETDGTITASIDKRIEGKNEVEITRDDGKKAKGECIVGTTSVTFTAQSQCKSAGDFSAENVSVKIFANTPTTIETEKPDPIINEKIKVDKDGKPAGFVPKLEKDKKYSLIVKAPGTLAKRVDFETKGGTRNLDAVTLPAGDIAPAISADGKVNAFDRSELIRQWSLVRDVQRSGDFNQDGRINSIDYACMRQNINQSDEEFSPPALTASPPPVGVGTTEPVGVGTTSPPPVGGPSGVLPFRVSFDPNFATIALDGDMGTETFLTVDLTLTGGPGLKSVYVQFFEDGVWGPEPAQTASIELK